MTGAVRLPLARSWPCGLPSCSVDCVKSRMSSTTWKARPRCLTYAYMASFTWEEEGGEAGVSACVLWLLVMQQCDFGSLCSVSH